MSLTESVDGGATLGAVVVLTLLLSLSVVFVLSSPFGPLSAGDLDTIQLIGVGTALLLSTVITAVFALKTITSDPF